jgi:uncharacterized protein (DUF1786 family)
MVENKIKEFIKRIYRGELKAEEQFSNYLFNTEEGKIIGFKKAKEIKEKFKDNEMIQNIFKKIKF